MPAGDRAERTRPGEDPRTRDTGDEDIIIIAHEKEDQPGDTTEEDTETNEPGITINITDLDNPNKTPVGFFEVEKTILTNAPVPTIERLRNQFTQAGGNLLGIAYAQPMVSTRGENLLVVILTITLKEAVKASELAIRMHNFGETNFVYIMKVTVCDGTTCFDLPDFIPASIGADSSISTNPIYSQNSMEKKFVFQEINIKRIAIQFYQTNPYRMRYVMAAFTSGSSDTPFSNIGWITDVSSKEIFKNLAEKYEDNLWERDEISTRIIAALPGLLDVFPIPSDNTGVPGRPVQSAFALSENIGEDGLITIPREESNRWRYAIGISEISIGRRKYSMASEYVSKPYPITKVNNITMDADVRIPDIFPAGDWIKFYVSLDDGATWHRILPINLPIVSGVPKILYVNSDIPDVYKDKNPAGRAAFVETSNPISSLRTRIELYRPVNTTSISPLVFSYHLVVR